MCFPPSWKTSTCLMQLSQVMRSLGMRCSKQIGFHHNTPLHKTQQANRRTPSTPWSNWRNEQALQIFILPDWCFFYWYWWQYAAILFTQIDQVWAQEDSNKGQEAETWGSCHTMILMLMPMLKSHFSAELYLFGLWNLSSQRMAVQRGREAPMRTK